jgi:ribosomal protein S18 acetylase RimI-like enzyme
MALTVHTDHAAIGAALHETLRTDPVGGTVLGTIAASLEDGAWCAVGDSRLAARSGFAHPVTFAGSWDTAASAELAALLADLPRLRGLSGPPPTVEPLLALLDRPTEHRSEQALHRLDELTPPRGVPGRAVVADEAMTDLVRTWFRAFTAEVAVHREDSDSQADRAVRSRGCFVWLGRDGQPVSMASRRPVVAGRARVGPVYTPTEQRGRGYGSAVTAAATSSILAEGGIPVLFTELANPTSNKIYRELGYRLVEYRLVVLFPLS